MLCAGRARSFGGNSLLLYPAILAASTLIRLFSEILKFKTATSFQIKKIVKENIESSRIFFLLK
jgi:hypothetical protein